MIPALLVEGYKVSQGFPFGENPKSPGEELELSGLLLQKTISNFHFLKYIYLDFALRIKQNI